MLTALLVVVMLSSGQEMETDQTRFISRDLAIGFLCDMLIDYGPCDQGFEREITFHIEFTDGLPDSVPRDFTDIALWKAPEHEGLTEPGEGELVDRFRVYTSGVILYWSELPGMYIQWEDYLEGRTEL